MLKKVLLFAGLFGILLASCSQEDGDRLAHDSATSEGPGVEVMLNFGAEQLRDTSLEQGQKAQSGRAFDYVVYDETNGGTTTTSSHLDLSSVKGDIKATVILRSTESSQPVTVGEITMERRTSYPDGSAVPTDRVYLHTKAGGSPVNAKAGTDFTKGTWSVALVIGGKRSGSTLTFDPNNLESVKYSNDSQSDQGIDLFSGQNKWNLKGITKSTKGDSYTDEEKVTLDVPFFSQWITLADGDFVNKAGGNNAIIFGSRFTLRPQGTLLRLEIKNENFTDIKLAGLRILTNMLAFRGKYDFSDANVRSSEDLASTWTGLRADGSALLDSADMNKGFGWSLPFPNYTDFWVKDKEDIATGAKSSKYYLIWAMPETVTASNATANVGRTTEQSRGGIMHVLLYDANRTGTEYNQPSGERYRGVVVLPKALIRKPLLTRNFPAGAFRLSSTALSGQTLRLVGYQTKIYTFLDFMEKEDKAGYHAYDEVATTSISGDQVLPALHNWASIFPGKQPDNPYSEWGFTFKHYLYTKSPNNSPAKSFNSPKYGNIPGGELIRTYPLVLSGEEKYTPAARAGLDSALSGKARNFASISIPEEMQIPYIVGDTKKPLLYATDAPNKDLYFSTYFFTLGGAGRSIGGNYSIIGWGQGQQFLTANAYHFDPTHQKLTIYSRYLGPAFHRPYRTKWNTNYSWDITWLVWNASPANPFVYTAEVDDTVRELSLAGYQYDGVQDTNNSSVNGSRNSLFYWVAGATEPTWMYFYCEDVSGNKGPQGVGPVANAKGEPYSAADQSKLKAYIRLFSKKAIK